MGWLKALKTLSGIEILPTLPKYFVKRLKALKTLSGIEITSGKMSSNLKLAKGSKPLKPYQGLKLKEEFDVGSVVAGLKAFKALPGIENVNGGDRSRGGPGLKTPKTLSGI